MSASHAEHKLTPKASEVFLVTSSRGAPAKRVSMFKPGTASAEFTSPKAELRLPRPEVSLVVSNVPVKQTYQRSSIIDRKFDKPSSVDKRPCATLWTPSRAPA